MAFPDTLALKSQNVVELRVQTGVWLHKPLHAFHERTLAHCTKFSHNFAQIKAAVSFEPVCMVGVAAKHHQSVSCKPSKLLTLLEQVCEPCC